MAIIDTSFAGANGAPWPAPWASAGQSGAATIQGGRGQLALAGNYQNRRAVSTVQVDDFIADFTWRQPQAAEKYVAVIAFRCSPINQWSGLWSPDSGYVIYLGVPWNATGSSPVDFECYGAGHDFEQFFPALPNLANTDYHFRVSAIGPEIKIYGGPAPFAGTWTWQGTDPGGPSSGHVGMGFISGDGGVGRIVQYGRILVAAPAAAPVDAGTADPLALTVATTAAGARPAAVVGSGDASLAAVLTASPAGAAPSAAVPAGAASPVSLSVDTSPAGTRPAADVPAGQATTHLDVHTTAAGVRPPAHVHLGTTALDVQVGTAPAGTPPAAAVPSGAAAPTAYDVAVDPSGVRPPATTHTGTAATVLHLDAPTTGAEPSAAIPSGAAPASYTLDVAPSGARPAAIVPVGSSAAPLAVDVTATGAPPGAGATAAHLTIAADPAGRPPAAAVPVGTAPLAVTLTVIPAGAVGDRVLADVTVTFTSRPLRHATAPIGLRPPATAAAGTPRHRVAGVQLRHTVGNVALRPPATASPGTVRHTTAPAPPRHTVGPVSTVRSR